MLLIDIRVVCNMYLCNIVHRQKKTTIINKGTVPAALMVLERNHFKYVGTNLYTNKKKRDTLKIIS